MGISISLENSVKEAIDDYMNYNRPLAIGYESHGMREFADACHAFFNKHNLPMLVRIKNECCQWSKRKEYEYRKTLEEKERHYFDNMSNYRFVWHSPIHKGHCWKGYAFELERDCMRFFSTNINDYTMIFVNDRYGSLEQAINETKSFVELWNGFEIWFDERRKKFMDKMELDIAKVKEMSTKKTPQSHGGVANLLKVLTQTMQKQGADIRNIAKVQYAICVQAGIYIPDEFIRDVAVCLDIDSK